MLFSSRLKLSVFLLLLATFSLSLTACAKNEITTGYSFDEAALNKLIQESSGKSRVQSLMGTPSAKSNFGQDTWYYIQRDYENTAFFKPDLTKQTVIAIHFDDKDEVVSVKKYTEQNARKFAYDKNTTPTEGHDLSVIEQLLGNFGRFNKQRNPLDTHGIGGDGT